MAAANKQTYIDAGRAAFERGDVPPSTPDNASWQQRAFDDGYAAALAWSLADASAHAHAAPFPGKRADDEPAKDELFALPASPYMLAPFSPAVADAIKTATNALARCVRVPNATRMHMERLCASAQDRGTSEARAVRLYRKVATLADKWTTRGVLAD